MLLLSVCDSSDLYAMKKKIVKKKSVFRARFRVIDQMTGVMGQRTEVVGQRSYTGKL